MKAIQSVTVRIIPDYDADLSWIGKFSDTAESEYAIEHEPGNSSSYAWFNSTNASNLTEAQSDYDEMMAYDRGDWSMVGVKASAKVVVNDTIQTIESGGLWGISIANYTDLETPDFLAVQDDELELLKQQLTELGFTKTQINKSFKDIEVKSE